MRRRSLLVIILILSMACGPLLHMGELPRTRQHVQQTGQYDCAIAALAMLLRQDYDTTLNMLTPMEMAAMHINRGFPVLLSPDPEHNMGSFLTVARRSGKPFAATRDFQVKKETGVLLIQLEGGAWHMVFLQEGNVYDPAFETHIPLEVYVKIRRFMPETLVFEVGQRRPR